jgi:mono/diheme cytochrome c family protein
MAAQRYMAGMGWVLAWGALSLSLLACRRAAPSEAATQADTEVAPQGTGADPAPAPSAPEPLVLTQVAAPQALDAHVELPEPDFSHAKKVYERRCAFCHGAAGDGKGPVAAELWPRPRSFVDEPFRFVSTDNGIPTEADVVRTISNGLPGSPMPPWRKLLPAADRAELARYLLWLPKKAAFERELAKAEERRSKGKSAPSPAEVLKKVEAAFTPGKVIELPPKPPFSRELLARGSELYAENCKACHGERGDGQSQQALKDGLGRAIRARSYNHGYYKGGYSDEQLAYRILAGLPGSPMPAFAPALKDPSDVWPLVYRVRQFEHRADSAVARGRLLFHQRGCASCHGVEGRGQVPNENFVAGRVKALDVLGTRLLVPDAGAAKLVVEALSKGTLAELADHPPYPQFNVTMAQYQALTTLIKDGNPAGRKNPRWRAPTFDMPSWKGELSNRQIDEILAYLVSLQRWDDTGE